MTRGPDEVDGEDRRRMWRVVVEKSQQTAATRDRRKLAVKVEDRRPQEMAGRDDLDGSIKGRVDSRARQRWSR